VGPIADRSGCGGPLTSPTGARNSHALDYVSQRLPVQIDAEALQRHVVQLAADSFEAFLAYKPHRSARNSDDIIIDGCRGRASGIATSALIAPGRAVMQ
jgi:hypothetical protein